MIITVSRYSKKGISCHNHRKYSIPIVSSFKDGRGTGKKELLERKLFSSILQELFVVGGINHENSV